MLVSKNKSSLLLVLSLILFLLSFAILGTWGYNNYFKKEVVKKGPEIFITDSATIVKTTRELASATRDSLQQIYAETIRNIDKKIDSSLSYADSLRAPLNEKLEEFFKLKTEISDILKDKNNDAGLGTARKKIAELQRKVDDLLGKNNEVEAENKRLYALLRQLSDDNKLTEQNSNTQVNRMVPVVFDNNKKAADKPTTTENLFQAYDLRLSAIMEIDDRELETSQAMQTDKLVGTFIVKNSNALNNVAELFIVVLQPDGRVLQKSSWESGTFDTNSGRKIYSCKLRFDYNRGEPKKLLFSINSDKYIKGNYTMQVYYNGTIIGKLYKTLT